MTNERSWTLIDIQGGWATLRRGPFTYTVPVDRLPPDVSPGAELSPEGGMSDGFPDFTEKDARARRPVISG